MKRFVIRSYSYNLIWNELFCGTQNYVCDIITSLLNGFALKTLIPFYSVKKGFITISICFRDLPDMSPEKFWLFNFESKFYRYCTTRNRTHSHM